MLDERLARRSLAAIALSGLAAGILLLIIGYPSTAHWVWIAGTVPVVAALAISMTRDLLAGRLGVDAVALLSTTGALALGEPLAAAVVAVMYAGGSILEDFAVDRAERDLRALVDRAPRIAHVRNAREIEDLPIEGVKVQDVLVIRAGEVIPVDGIIIAAAATIDESALTGEPIPVNRGKGEHVRSGTLNAGETFEITASAIAGDSTYAGIVRMVTTAQTAKSPFIRLADRYALLLLPVTLLVAGGAWWTSGDVIRGLAVLVAATPCPLIIAAPVAFIAGVAQAARKGILMKGGGPLEALARAHTVMFDKTGTLTVGGARLVAIETAADESADNVLQLAASLEQASHHVMAAAIVAAAVTKGLSLKMAETVTETMGAGLEGRLDGHDIRVGSYPLVFGARRPEPWAQRAIRRASWRSALTVFVSANGKPMGALLLADELRQETPQTVAALRHAGISRIVMVTGDRADTADTIAAALDLDAVLADRAPGDKVAAVAAEQKQHPTIMVGDGINDAPALAAADVGIAMGARGASASSQAADIVILVDRLDRVADAVIIARRARHIAVQSIVVGLSLSGVAMALATFGWLSPVAGALSQEAIDVAVILNALRALGPARSSIKPSLSQSTVRVLHDEHRVMQDGLDRLRAIADALDDAQPDNAVTLIEEANAIVSHSIVVHERGDENTIYPRLAKDLTQLNGLTAMSRAHREILHSARLLSRLANGLMPNDADRYLVRDAQRVIESIEALVRLHNAQEEDIYERAAA